MSKKKKEEEKGNKLLHKPASRAVEQQRLPAWQPNLTPGTVLPMFFLVGFAFVPIGVAILYYSANTQELSMDYTFCRAGSETCVDQVSVSICACPPRRIEQVLTQSFRKPRSSPLKKKTNRSARRCI
jgi:hypothetical protein